MNQDNKKTFDILAAELCRRVKAPYPPPEGKPIKPQDYEWTQAEEDDFKKWMKEYLLSVPGWRQMGTRFIKKEIEWFVFNFGWKTK